MESQDIIRLVLQLIYGTTAVGIVFIVITENRNPLKTISWALLLLFFPIGGIIVYYFFGQDARKIRIISRKTYKRLKKHSFNHLIMHDTGNIRSEFLPLVKLLNYNNNAALLQGSEIKIFTNGPEKFAALLADLEQARHHIHLQYYIFLDDEIGKKVKEMLSRKAQEGVEVRVLYDAVANWQVKNRFYNEMSAYGVEITAFRKVRFPFLTSKVNYRNHRKVVVIDGRIGYIGGMNIADRYLKPNWRDTHLRVEGKGALGMQSAFLIDWLSSGKQLVDEKIYFPDARVVTDNIMQIATGGPVGLWRTLLQATVQIIACAKKYVYIQTPYFMPTDGLLQTLQSVALAGIDVRLMVAWRADVRFVSTATHSFFEDILNAGVKIYVMDPGFLHAKMIVVDDFLTVAGSANMDFRSFEHNFEVNAYMYDDEIALQMKRIFLNDQKACRRILRKEWRKRPPFRKIQESVMRMFSPLL